MSRDVEAVWKQAAQREKKLAEYVEAQRVEEKDHATNLIADLLFAFINKDDDCPHDFEIKAFEDAIHYLNEHQQSKYNPKLFEGYLKQMREVME